MKIPIALFSVLATSLLAIPLSTHGSMSQERYPSRPVRMIVPYPAGGPTDVPARLVAARLSAALGGNFYVENVPGAAGSLGAHAVGAAAADGYTLLWMNQDFVVQPLIKQHIPYDTSHGFAPISFVATAPEAIMVNPSVPARTVSELVALIKANPGKYTYATPGFGTSPHLAGERLFNLTYHLDITQVPFQGGAPAIASTMGGHTQILLITIGSVAPNLKDGSLRAIAVESPKRWPAFPDVPTLAESGLVDYDAEFVLGLMAPAGTPKSIVDLLSRETAKALADQDTKDRLDAQGLQPVGSGPAEFAAKLKDVSASWAKVVQGAGIKTD
jgi:tripartite-type tricarboxylate transporter receptor subunit TctC